MSAKLVIAKVDVAQRLDVRAKVDVAQRVVKVLRNCRSRSSGMISVSRATAAAMMGVVSMHKMARH